MTPPPSEVDPGMPDQPSSAESIPRKGPLRDANVDLLRAAAILLVLAYHINDMWPGRSGLSKGTIDHLLHLGQYGVDLFFVLSGWLIGGLYWREEQRHGAVGILSFWKRRWLRTIPPYAVALLLAWGAAFVMRKQAFDPAYLVFLQNYRIDLPYFLVSWSLCIEEHFYLVLPLYLGGLRRFRINPILGLLAVVGASPVCRWVQVGVPPSDHFGFAFTASHLRAEGLALGVILSRVAALHPEPWTRLTRLSRGLSVPALALFVSVAFWPRQGVYLAGLTVIPIVWAIVLAAVAGARPLPGAASRLTYGVAITSFSVYLTHSLVIHAGKVLAARVPQLTGFPLLIIWLALIYGTGAAYYWAVEKTSLWLRDRVAPSRR